MHRKAFLNCKTLFKYVQWLKFTSDKMKTKVGEVSKETLQSKETGVIGQRRVRARHHQT